MHATQKFSPLIKVFARLFQKAAGSRAIRPCRAPQSAKLPRLGDADTHASHMCQSPLGVFFFVAFSFAPVYAKEKADRHKSFVLAVGCTWVLVCRGRRLDDPR